MEDNNKIDKLLAMKNKAFKDITLTKKLVKESPCDKGLKVCLNQAIDTFKACELFIKICTDGDDDVCWGLSCAYYDNGDHFIKNDGTINKWCLACCKADNKEQLTN